MSIPILTQNQFKETSRYLQETLSEYFKEDIKLSAAQEVLSRAQGFKDYHAWQHWHKTIQNIPKEAKFANGDIAIELQSLRFCLNAARGDSGGQRVIRNILLHLYNPEFYAELKLSSLDREHKIHMLNVLSLDARGGQEIHEYIQDSEYLFSKWADERAKDFDMPYSMARNFIIFSALNSNSKGGVMFFEHWRSTYYDIENGRLDENDKEAVRKILNQYF